MELTCACPLNRNLFLGIMLVNGMHGPIAGLGHRALSMALTDGTPTSQFFRLMETVDLVPAQLTVLSF